MSAMSFPDNIESKLDGLALVDNEETDHSTLRFQYVAKPKTSLLSSSLAGERRMNESKSTSVQKSPRSPAFFTIDEGLLPSDHPEPELLATSVGKDIDGRLIPSSSTISLLSLNGPGQMTSPRVNGQQATFGQFQPVLIDRKNSHHNISSRNSITHLNHVRLQPYQKYTSPTPGGSNQQPEYIAFNAPTQSIPINNNMIVPDSPNLDPTSLGGSPSRFWLSSQTPPRSLANSLKSSRTQLYQLHPQHHSAHQQLQQQLHPQHDHYYSMSKAININKKGDASPTLNPVQTPSEDPPMTPLYLNSNMERTDYFEIPQRSEQDEEEEGPTDESQDTLMN